MREEGRKEYSGEGGKVYFCEFEKRCAINRLGEFAARLGNLGIFSATRTTRCLTLNSATPHRT